MGFRKKLESKSAVKMNYGRISNVSFNEDNSLKITVDMYVSLSAYRQGALPVERRECITSDAEDMKSVFYDYLSLVFPDFKGAIKDTSASVPKEKRRQTLTVQTPRGDLVSQVEVGEPETPEVLPPIEPPIMPQLPPIEAPQLPPIDEPQESDEPETSEPETTPEDLEGENPNMEE